MIEKTQWVSINYQEDTKTKEWLDKNTGKTRMSLFIREAVAEKIAKVNKK